jgi:hypothetical protein
MTTGRQWFQGLRSAVESGSCAKRATAAVAIVTNPALGGEVCWAAQGANAKTSVAALGACVAILVCHVSSDNGVFLDGLFSTKST